MHLPSVVMLQMPPPSLQRCLSASSAQENGFVTSSPFGSFGGIDGGEHVAAVKASTNLRTKKRGNVPPRLLTLTSGLARLLTILDQNTHVASNVMYVPPMTGSAIFAWKALTATNMTVLMNVLKMCSAMTTSRYQVVVPPLGNIATTN